MYVPGKYTGEQIDELIALAYQLPPLAHGIMFNLELIDTIQKEYQFKASYLFVGDTLWRKLLVYQEFCVKFEPSLKFQDVSLGYVGVYKDLDILTDIYILRNVQPLPDIRNMLAVFNQDTGYAVVASL